MTGQLRPAHIDWSQGMPYAPDFGDVYFSRDGGPAETRHVFLEGNRLPERLAALTPQQSFTIIETGFGTGLNWLCTQALWAECPRTGWLHVVSMEKHPLLLADLVRAHGHWPEFSRFATLLQQRYPQPVPGFHRLLFPALRSTLTLVFSEVTEALPRLCASADAFFLDGFAPARNPDMWQPGVYAQMARLGKAGSTFATFTAAGDVRRGLQNVGFTAEKMPGFGKKREMLRGVLIGTTDAPADAALKPWLSRPPLTADRAGRLEALVIGAGIAGATTARALAERGWQVTVLEKHEVAGAASGNPAAVVALTPAPAGEVLDHFPQQAGVHTLRELNAGEAAGAWHACGVMELPAENRRRNEELPACSLPASLWCTVEGKDATALAGTAIPVHARWQAQSGWLDAAVFCRQQLAHPNIRVRERAVIARLEHQAAEWVACDDQGQALACAAVAILAAGTAARHFVQATDLPLRAVRGQVSLALATPATRSLRCVVCERGYITPALPDGQHCIGASFVPDDTNTAIRESEHAENLSQLQAMLPAIATALPPLVEWRGRATVRCQSPDYLPLVGPLAASTAFDTAYAGLRDGKTGGYPELPALPGLYVNLGHGSRGFTQALLAADILAAELNGEPAPVARKVLDALHPMRFRARGLRRHRHPGNISGTQ